MATLQLGCMSLRCCAASGLFSCYFIFAANRRFLPNYNGLFKKFKEEKRLNIFTGFLRDFRLVVALNREGGTASARGFGIGVADNKL